MKRTDQPNSTKSLFGVKPHTPAILQLKILKNVTGIAIITDAHTEKIIVLTKVNLLLVSIKRF
jgi:hypothetical protein